MGPTPAAVLDLASLVGTGHSKGGGISGASRKQTIHVSELLSSPSQAQAEQVDAEERLWWQQPFESPEEQHGQMMGHQEQQRQRLQWQQWHQWQEHEHSANIGRQMLLEQQQRERWQWQQELHQQQIEQLAAMTSGEASYSSEWDTQSSHQTSTASRGRRAREARRRQRTDECCELPAGPVLPQKPQDGQFDSQASDATTAASESGRSGETEASTEFKDDEDLSLLIQMEGAQTSQEVLAAAHQVLARLSPETTVAALHLAARHAPATATGAASPHLAAILAHLRRLLPRLRQSRCLSRLAWTLGKLEVRTPDVEAAVCHICAVAPQSLQKFTSQDLTNTLWGLARLFPAATDRRGRGNSSSSSNVGTQVARLATVASVAVACAAPLMRQPSASPTPSGPPPGSASEVLGWRISCGIPSKSFKAVTGNWRCSRHRQELDYFENSGGRDAVRKQARTQGLANMLWAIAELKAAGVGAGANLSLTEAGTPSFEASREACAMVAGAAASRVHEHGPWRNCMARLFNLQPLQPGPIIDSWTQSVAALEVKVGGKAPGSSSDDVISKGLSPHEGYWDEDTHFWPW
ncbi:unnamed protein product [Polarella glacialis]|uniref:Uncharacterized protein n=1 Tax=Polarella glacialis TaxID=89957 RepID=A0A813G280_POLGL|nr:unnamed protein product [Polarella glacialis]